MPGDPFYRSAAWFRLRHACLERDNGTCTTTGCGKPATHADHIIARAKGGPDTIANLTSQCPSCHSRKTARQDGGFGHAQTRQRAVSANGWPADVQVPTATPAGSRRSP
jgi:5-methylcytosine-specific restriction protein A